MKKSCLAAMLAACVGLLSVVSEAAAQQGPVAPAARAPHGPPVIALLDVSYIFKMHTRFKAMMNEMKGDVERAESTMKKERDQIMAMAERLKELRQGTPDYKTLEEDITKRQADLSVRVSLQKKEFLQREAKIYYTVYQEIAQETDYYAKQYGIDMVLRFNGDQVDVEKPDDVLRDINKPVVWYAKDRDITPVILDALNRRYAGPGGNGQPSGPAATRTGVPFPQYK